MSQQYHKYTYMDIYPKEVKMGIQVFVHQCLIPDLFTITKRRKYTKCPSIHQQINKMWYRYIHYKGMVKG